ncbi:putative necrosis-inducing factor-domain-containing protein [Lasiosphaeria miniovina]|uniref:Necrosis-inducing factor-domain-containing protein n=1 Tax=Lasiosphaeria miniovina TaxID=1954250 RepID=A0AA40ABK3_9PEZI|nr:putative necrosis-inducing factor-domain-containing protein [Lasiosphaeria miniovina]KAK0712633.1 putative necrosis-inducing factor-domain-containing protein [Lasiosphaeria miniovina]
MHRLLGLAIAASALLALAQATPAPVVGGGGGGDSADSVPVFRRADDNKPEKDCGKSNITDQTSFASPLARDCMQLAANIRSGGGWSIFGPWQKEIAQFGTCAFGVTGISITGRLETFYVGNQDVIDSITDSVQQFQHLGRDGNPIIGCEGKMGCNARISDDLIVTWGIYHTK